MESGYRIGCENEEGEEGDDSPAYSDLALQDSHSQMVSMEDDEGDIVEDGHAF